jgi:hypothetical protein
MITGDLLSAASLLLTVLTILYSLWYPEINNASDLPVDDHSANRKLPHEQARGVFLTKALPLSIATLALFVTATPPALDIMRHPFVRNFALYDAVSTIFVAVVAVLLFLSGHIVKSAWKLGAHVHELNPKRGDY